MISKKEVKHIADLARVGVNDEEINRFSQDLSSILDWMEQLNEIDVEKVEPTAHITGLENRTREDKESDFENKEGIIKLFPEEKNNYNKVKSVL
jgi:aspartyl-tRNA(Asn)/glutamyl-tRNA(Gln) amidotransferase subunit C